MVVLRVRGSALGLVSVAVLAAVWQRQPERASSSPGAFPVPGSNGRAHTGMAWARGGMGEGYIFVGHYRPQNSSRPVLYLLRFRRLWRAGRPCSRTDGVVHDRVYFSLAERGEGINWVPSGFWYRHSLERDLRAGIPPFILADRYGRYLTGHDNKPEMVAALLRKLQRDNIGEFRHMQADPVFIEAPVLVKPASLHEMTWEGGVGYAKGNDPHLVFALTHPNWSTPSDSNCLIQASRAKGHSLQVFWRRTEKNDFAEGERAFTTQVEAVPEGKTVTVWVNDTIDQFRIDPDTGPSVFSVSDLRVLVPGTR